MKKWKIFIFYLLFSLVLETAAGLIGAVAGIVYSLIHAGKIDSFVTIVCGAVAILLTGIATIAEYIKLEKQEIWIR